MRLTYKQSIDGYTDVGMNPGVTIDEAVCKLADLEDSVEVVRCKDCKFWDCYGGEEKHKGDCLELELDCCMYEDDFCSYGERRDNDATD